MHAYNLQNLIEVFKFGKKVEQFHANSTENSIFVLEKNKLKIFGWNA